MAEEKKQEVVQISTVRELLKIVPPGTMDRPENVQLIDALVAEQLPWDRAVVLPTAVGGLLVSGETAEVAAEMLDEANAKLNESRDKDHQIPPVETKTLRDMLFHRNSRFKVKDHFKGDLYKPDGKCWLTADQLAGMKIEEILKTQHMAEAGDDLLSSYCPVYNKYIEGVRSYCMEELKKDPDRKIHELINEYEKQQKEKNVRLPFLRKTRLMKAEFWTHRGGQKKKQVVYLVAAGWAVPHIIDLVLKKTKSQARVFHMAVHSALANILLYGEIQNKNLDEFKQKHGEKIRAALRQKLGAVKGAENLKPATAPATAENGEQVH